MKRNAGPTVETLCHQCVEAYRDAGFVVNKIPGQKYKDSCTHCQRGQGWDYEVRDKMDKQVRKAGDPISPNGSGL